MNATAPSSTTPESAKASAGLIEQISFQKIFDGLSQHGITLSAAEQERLEEIVREEVRKQNGGALAGMNIPGAGVNLIQILFAFIQQLAASFSGTSEFSLASFTDGLSNAATGATNSGKQYVFNLINTNIYDRLRAERGKLAEAADVITGVRLGGEYARDNLLEDQMQAWAKVPESTTSTLNPLTDVADASAGNGLPPSARGALTPRALGA